MILSNYQFYSFEELKQYYSFEEDNPEELIENTVILHLSSKEKPWLYYDMVFTELWDAYYSISPYKNIALKRKSVRINTASKEELLEESEYYRQLYNSAINSTSFKIGKIITFFPRIIVNWKNERKKKRILFRKNGLNEE